MREKASASLDDHTAAETFARIATDPFEAPACLPMSGLVTQQAWFMRDRYHHLARQAAKP
jgi:hypothetical protein